MPLLGLSGRAQSGKDTAYGFIKTYCDEAGIPCKRDAFADRLKLSAARTLGFKGDLAEAVEFCNKIKQEGVTIGVWGPIDEGAWIPNVLAQLSGREFLQYYGTEAHREVFGSDFWVDALMEDLPTDNTLVVVTDVRFDNEAKAIRPGEVWEILRAGQSDKDGHASEQPISREYVDRKILNNQGIGHFQVKILHALEDLLVAEGLCQS